MASQLDLWTQPLPAGARRVPAEYWEQFTRYGQDFTRSHDYSGRESTSAKDREMGATMSKAAEFDVWLRYTDLGYKLDPPNTAIIHDPTRRRFGADVAGHAHKVDYRRTDSVLFNVGPERRDIDPLSQGHAPSGMAIIISESLPKFGYPPVFRIVAVVDPATVPVRLKMPYNRNPNKRALYFADLTEEERNAALPLPRG